MLGSAAGRFLERSNARLVSPGRLHALIDGVVAIAITLLVLDLPRPHGATHLASDLFHSWPSYLAYFASFATVGVIWTEHLGMMSAVREVNRRFVEHTLVFLLFLSIIPWPTALAAEYLRDGGAAARTATLLYGSTMLLMGAAMTLSWRYLANHEQLTVADARPALRAATRRSMLGAVAYVAVLLLALVSSVAALVLAAAIAVYFALSRTAVPMLALGR